MRIDDNFSPSGDLRSSSVSKPAESRVESRTSERKPEQATSDTASLSALGAELARALERDEPETVDRISRLQEAVQNGSYQTRDAEVSSRIVASAVGAEF